MNQEKTIVILKLFEPASQLAPFCPEAPENYIKITFPHSLNGKVVIVLLTILHVDHLLRLNFRNNSIFMSESIFHKITPILGIKK